MPSNHIEGEVTMPVTCTKLTETFAAEVAGIDIAVGVSDTDMADVVRLFNDFSVLVLHDQDINDEQQIRFSRKFSELGDFGGLEGTVLTNDGAGSAIALISNVDP